MTDHVYRMPLHRHQDILTASNGCVFLCRTMDGADQIAAVDGVAVASYHQRLADNDLSILTARPIMAVVENDEHAEAWATEVADALRGVTDRVRFVSPSAGATIADHLAAAPPDQNLAFGWVPYTPPAATAGASADQPLAEPISVVERFPRINWREAFAMDFSQVDWLPGKLMERGQQVAMVGDGKVGKSLFAQEWLWRAVTGRSFLGDERRDPLRVLYFDRENNLRDIITRMRSFGAEQSIDELMDSFDYRLFPKFSGGLDAAGVAAREMLDIVDESKPNVVVLDTVSRFIVGKENDADTWLQLYGRVHAPLKSMGIAGVRLDHFGKDTDRGGRGSSAKSQDVDHVWEMTCVGESALRTPEHTTVVSEIKLKRSHTRTGLGEDLLMVTRRGVKAASGLWLDGMTRHELSAADEPHSIAAQVRGCVDELIRRGVPAGLGREKLRDWARAHGVTLPGKNDTLAQVVAALKVPRSEAA